MAVTNVRIARHGSPTHTYATRPASASNPRDIPGISTTTVARFTGVSLRQLQWWDEQGHICPMKIGHARSYTPRQAFQVILLAQISRARSTSWRERKRVGRLRPVMDVIRAASKSDLRWLLVKYPFASATGDLGYRLMGAAFDVLQSIVGEPIVVFDLDSVRELELKIIRAKAC